jgi:hypothetical protein
MGLQAYVMVLHFCEKSVILQMFDLLEPLKTNRTFERAAGAAFVQ